MLVGDSRLLIVRAVGAGQMSWLARLIAAIVFFISANANGGEDLFSGCIGDGGEVKVQETDIPGLVQADPNQRVIRANPRSEYASILSDKTVRWLFFRECDVVLRKLSGEETADPDVAAGVDCRA